MTDNDTTVDQELARAREELIPQIPELADLQEKKQ